MLIKSMLSVLSRHSAYLHQSPLALIHTSPAVPASALATLRKNTGYSLSICKKALGETGDDVQAAEKWLREQAQAQGWAKAQKLQGRNTSQGLLGVLVRADTAAMVEVNCETDFVARNQQFVSLLQQVAASCVANSSGEAAAAEMELSTTAISPGELGTSPSVEAGKTVGDLVALFQDYRRAVQTGPGGEGGGLGRFLHLDAKSLRLADVEGLLREYRRACA